MKKELLKRCVDNFLTINDYELVYNNPNESRDISVQNLIYDGIFENSLEGIIELYKKEEKEKVSFINKSNIKTIKKNIKCLL